MILKEPEILNISRQSRKVPQSQKNSSCPNFPLAYFNFIPFLNERNSIVLKITWCASPLPEVQFSNSSGLSCYSVSALSAFCDAPFSSPLHVPTTSRLLLQTLVETLALSCRRNLRLFWAQLSDSLSTATKPTAPSKTSPAVIKNTCSRLFDRI